LKRRLFNLAAVVSLVLCVAMVMLWPLSFPAESEAHARIIPPVRIGLYYSGARCNGGVWVHHGRIVADRYGPDDAPLWRVLRNWRTTPNFATSDPTFIDRSTKTSRFAGFGIASVYWRMSSSPTSWSRCAVAAPLWFPVVGLLVLPAFRLCHFLRVRSRRMHGLCLTCGYDLRESPLMCPECGAEAKPQPAAGAAA
jgi:hypothetical protein